MTASIEELGHAALDDFTRRLAEVPADNQWRFHDEARRLETEVLMLFKATVIGTKKMASLGDIAKAWSEMVAVCGKAIAALSLLVKEHPDCNAEVYHDRLIALGAKCQRFQKLHS
jgi:hypothetical protein